MKARGLLNWLPACLLGVLVVAWRIVAVKGSGVSLYVDEAQYWGWAQALDWGYFSKPPGVAVLIYLSTALFGDSVLGVKLLSMLCYPLVAVLAHRIAEPLYGRTAARWSALVVLFMPIFAWLGLVVSTDALLVLFWTAALLFYIRALEHNRLADWLALGVICGLGLLSKYTMLAWIASAFLHLLLFRRDRLRSAMPWLSAGLALLFLVPNLLWNVANDFPTLRHTADITLRNETRNHLGSLLEFWAAQWGCLGPVFGVAFVWALVRPGPALPERPGGSLLLWFALPLWAIASAQAFMGGANANWAGPAFVPAAIFVVGWLVQHGRTRWLVAGLVVNILLAVPMYHWNTLSPLFGGENIRSPYSRALGWAELMQQLAPLVQAHPDAVVSAPSRTLMAHMVYELRELQPTLASWNPQKLRDDHYRLTTRLEDHAGRDVLLLWEGSLPDEVKASFASAERLAVLKSEAGPWVTRTLEVYLLHDFKGY